jgi:serine/threonine protein kinase
MDRIADYQLIKEIGQGNHGRFYLARPPARLPIREDYVAVKLIEGSGTTEDTFRRATRELRAFAAVQSPYLVRLFDAGQDRGSFFYAMEYLALGSLATPARALTRFEKLRAVVHAALAAHGLHESGMVHRDIKPGNILLHADGARLSDLGLTQVLSPGLTVTGMGSLGSVQYTDPAILRGSRASRGTDIWSLGVTLHYALTGAGVYPSPAANDALLAVRTVLKGEPHLDERLTPAELAIVQRCLAPAPTDRFPTAAALAEQIDQLAQSAPGPSIPAGRA